jgi:uncharacterized protein YaiL (DUF2058 family)
VAKKKSGGSLQDQLRSAGLVTDKQLKKAQKGIHRQEMRVKAGVEVDETKVAAEIALTDKQNRGREHNETRQREVHAKELQAQIKQLVERNSQREGGDVEYNFTDGKKVKKIYVSALNKAQLNKGFLAIVKLGEHYDLVPEKVATRISDRIPETKAEVILYLHDRSKDVIDEDDPYKDFQIPDDLEW